MRSATAKIILRKLRNICQLTHFYKCLMLIHEEGRSKEEAIAIADEMKPDDWYEAWLDLKKMINNAKNDAGL